MTRICPPTVAPPAVLFSSPLRYMTALMALRGLLSVPTCERISATQDSLLGGRLPKTYTRL